MILFICAGLFILSGTVFALSRDLRTNGEASVLKLGEDISQAALGTAAGLMARIVQVAIMLGVVVVGLWLILFILGVLVRGVAFLWQLVF